MFQAKRGQLSSDRPLDIPKELYWLVDHLFKYGMQQVSITGGGGVREGGGDL